MKYLILFAALAAGLAAGPHMARAAEHELEYQRFTRIAERLAAAKKYDCLDTVMRVRAAKGTPPPDQLVLTIMSAAGPREIRPKADGTIVLPDDPSLAKENPKVRVNIPKEDKLNVGVVIRLRLGNQTTIQFAQIQRCLGQLNDGIAEQAGMMSFMAPSANAVRLRCGSGCVATLPGGDPAEIKADANGNVVIEERVYRRVPNLAITLSAPLIEAFPVIK